MACIGVLALQGDVEDHLISLQKLGHQALAIRSANALAQIDGLVLPGGESSAHLKLLKLLQMMEPLEAFLKSQKPILATCAGLILLAKNVYHPEQHSFGVLNVDVSRNSWGRQIDSFEATSDDGKHPLVFIRAPRLVRIGENVEVLARYHQEPIMVRQGSIVGATFHPELTADLAVHALTFGNHNALYAEHSPQRSAA